ncbi:hypothetical protein F5888DRAFT_1806235 [Russula emetica]|nr:hypothetical protein F5888DRAFT_1806235 [Russula emetica]
MTRLMFSPSSPRDQPDDDTRALSIPTVAPQVHTRIEHLCPSHPLQVTMEMEMVLTASSPTVTTDPSTSQYNDTFGRALKVFEKPMGQDHKPTDFESAKAVLEVLGETVQLFDVNGFRASNQSLKMWLESYVDILFTVSATL